MCLRHTPWLIMGLVLASAFFLRTDSPAFAQEATVYLDDGVLVAYQGLRESDVTLTGGVDASTETIPISEPARLKVGQIVETQDASKEIMEVTGLGPGSEMQVIRARLGTSAAPHNGGTALYADFTAAKVMVSDVSYRPTGATLLAAVDDGTLENSGAFLAQSIGTTETSIPISDATLLTDATAVRFDGTSFVSVANGTFLGSTGRSVMCPYYARTGNSIGYGCATLGATPSGPNGNGILAEVRLRAEREGPVPLSLRDVMLADIEGIQMPVAEVVNGTATIVSGSVPPPPPPGTSCDGTGDTKVCVRPPEQTVSVGSEFSVYVVAQNVTNLGAYQFTLGWSPASEEMSVQEVRRGFMNDLGQPWDRGVTLAAAINDTATVISVNTTSPLQVGWTALVESEEMLIAGVSTGSMTVIRGYNDTSAAGHGGGTPVYAGPERIIVQRDSPAAHSAGSAFRVDLRVLHVSDHNLLTASALQIDDERFKVAEVPARTLRDTGLSLGSGIDAGAVLLSVSGAGGLLQKGWTLQVDDELMPVIDVPGPNTLEVARGFFGSEATNHSTGASLWAVFPEANTVRVSRGFQGTPIQSHGAGASIIDVDGLDSYGFTLTSEDPNVADIVWANNGVFLGQTGRTVQCDPPVVGTADISFQCDTDGESPLGPTGSGTLATVNVSGKALIPSTPNQALNLSAVTLHDVSGDALPVTVEPGSAKVVRCPDVDDNRVVKFTTDVIHIAKVALKIDGYPEDLEEHDLDLNGAVKFTTDVIMAAKLALVSPSLRCPPLP